MTKPVDAMRRSVSRVLRFRKYRNCVCLAIIATDVAILLAPGVGPVLHVFLPMMTLPLFVPLFVFSRYRLPDQEWQGCPRISSQAAVIEGCAGTHMLCRISGEYVGDQDQNVTLRASRSRRGIRARREFLVAETRDIFLLATPRSYWLQSGAQVRFGDAASLGVDLFSITEEVRSLRIDDEVLSRTWLHTTKRGERDLRYKRNPRLYEVRRYGVEFSMDDNRWAVILYSRDNALIFANAFLSISMRTLREDPVEEDNVGEEEEEEEEEEEGYYDETFSDVESSEKDTNRQWYDVLAVSPKASVAEIKSAYRERLKEYHPDRVAHLGEKLCLLANDEATAINGAFAEAIRQARR